MRGGGGVTGCWEFGGGCGLTRVCGKTGGGVA